MKEIKTIDDIKVAFREILDEKVGGAEVVLPLLLFEDGSRQVKETVKKELCSTYGFTEEFSQFAWETVMGSDEKEENYKLLESMLNDPKYKIN